MSRLVFRAPWALLPLFAATLLASRPMQPAAQPAAQSDSRPTTQSAQSPSSSSPSSQAVSAANAEAASSEQSEAFVHALNRHLDVSLGKVNVVIARLLFFGITGDMIQEPMIGRDGQPALAHTLEPGGNLLLPANHGYEMAVLLEGKVGVKQSGAEIPLRPRQGQDLNPDRPAEIANLQNDTPAKFMLGHPIRIAPGKNHIEISDPKRQTLLYPISGRVEIQTLQAPQGPRRYSEKPQTLEVQTPAPGESVVVPPTAVVNIQNTGEKPALLALVLQRLTVVQFPLIVAVLIFGAVFFSLVFRFINVRAFRHAIDVTRGKYDRPEDEGEVTHFRALTSALSATVGLGNIAGVAVAIQLGGPGAVFWMTLAGFLGMVTKFTECTLGQMYRKVNPDGTISGGAMYYLERGLGEYGAAFKPLGKVLALIFAFMAIGGSFGGGNMFQANQAFESIQFVFGIPKSQSWIFGIIMAALVGLVVVGGIKRIGAATSRIVPLMALIYAVAAMVICIRYIHRVPEAISVIFRMAFSENAVYGGVFGVLVMGVRRSTFSNEAGLGSAPIAHSAAKTNEPVREGIVALLEPFIDTVIICNITAIVIILTGVWNDPNLPLPADFNVGVALTKYAFQTVIPWFPAILVICVILFAYSTMISWCYYGERAWIYLADHFGEGVGIKTLLIYRIVFVAFAYIGTVTKLGAVLDFSDIMILSMAFPNVLGCVLLSPKVYRRVEDYWRRYKSGEMKAVR